MYFSATYYQLLGVADDASTDEINKAANAKLKQFHPDVAEEVHKKVAHERAIVLNEAKRVLTDALLREEYNETLKRPPTIQIACIFKHDWKEIPAIDDLHKCGRIFVCNRCNERKAGRAHDLGSEWRFHKEASCERARQCRRCGEYVQQLDMQAVMAAAAAATRNFETIHYNWSQWRQIDSECKEMRRCERCGKEEIRQIVHVFTKWRWVNEKLRCDQRRRCVRCDHRDTRQMHDFFGSKRSINTGKPVTCCRFCGRAESQ